MSFYEGYYVDYDNIRGFVKFDLLAVFQLSFSAYFHIGLFFEQLCTQHAPKSISAPETGLLTILPPILYLAYKTIKGTPALYKRKAAPIPAAPAPIIITS